MKDVEYIFAKFDWPLASQRVLLARFVEEQNLIEAFQNFLEEFHKDEKKYLEEEGDTGVIHD